MWFSSVGFIHWILVCGMCAAGFHASYTDLKSGVIRNGCSLGLVAVGLVCQTYLCWVGDSAWSELGIVLAVAIGVAILLYLKRVWSPGDAKLYLGMAVAFPAGMFPEGRMLSTENAPVALLLHSFGLYFAASLVVALCRPMARAAHRISAWRTAVSQLLLAAASAGLVVLVVGGLMQRVMGYADALFLVLGVALLLGGAMSHPLGTGALVALTLGGLYAAAHSAGLLAHVALSLCAALGLLGYELLKVLGGAGIIRPVELTAVTAGLVPAVAFITRSTGAGTAGYRFSDRATKGALCQPHSPLTLQQARHIREWAWTGGDGSSGVTLPVVGVLPFAPFLGAGMVVTVLSAGSVARLFTVVLGTPG